MGLTWNRLWAVGRRHPLLTDACLALALVVPAVIGVRMGAHDGVPQVLGFSDYLAVVASFVAVTVRRRWPVTALIGLSAVFAVCQLVGSDRQPALILALLVVSATVGANRERRTAWLVGCGCAAALFVIGGLAHQGWLSPEILGTVAWIGMATAVGDASRSRRAYIAEVEERARRAEESREEEARRRVAEERLRIARELHDVVAHHIAVINVQAGAATHVLKTRPEQVGPALAHIRRASDTVLKELAAVLGVLRNSDDPDAANEPTRGLDRLAELLDAFAASGLRVDHRQVGTARDLSAVVDLAAYRIVQEALTNAQKHGAGTACLTVSYLPDAVLLEVVNAVAAGQSGAGSGYGIIGMRERAAAAGGTVTAAVTGGGRFTVRAELPGGAS